MIQDKGYDPNEDSDVGAITGGMADIGVSDVLNPETGDVVMTERPFSQNKPDAPTSSRPTVGEDPNKMPEVDPDFVPRNYCVCMKDGNMFCHLCSKWHSAEHAGSKEHLSKVGRTHGILGDKSRASRPE